MHNYLVGDGVAMSYGSDRKAGTVVEVSASGKTVKVQRDFVTLVSNGKFYGNQLYEFARDPDGFIEVFRFSQKYEKFRAQGWINLAPGRSEYFDPHF